MLYLVGDVGLGLVSLGGVFSKIEGNVPVVIYPPVFGDLCNARSG